jgi:murein DD-endopeptidase MepM/ murein hydrolase activator NlpD
MSGKTTLSIVASLAAALLLCGGGLVVLLLGGAALGACGTPLPTLSVGTPTGGGLGQWNAVQVSNATTIVGVAKGLNVPPRGWVIALATAMQESTLRNLANDNPAYPTVARLSQALPHDGLGHDNASVGLFQQLPLEGDGAWGTVAELMQPKIAASKFLHTLLRVDGWEQLPVGAAAQAVQRSGVPDGYDDDVPAAEALAAALAGVGSIEDIGGGDPATPCGVVDDGNFVVSPSGWTQPVKAPVVAPWGEFRAGQGNSQSHRHAGVDLGAKRGTPIRAAASGRVMVSKCNAPAWHGCDQDGFPGLGGCGWYVAVLHEGNVQTQYCHMGHQPLVKVGDEVTVGQILGYVGSSGNSSGPHLHFEVHLHSPRAGGNSFANSVNPVPFMASQGAPIGNTWRKAS